VLFFFLMRVRAVLAITREAMALDLIFKRQESAFLS